MSPKLEQILEKMDQMPEPPQAAVEAVNMLENPEIPVAKIAEFISMDECLTSKLLKISNLAHYGYSRQVATVKDALIRIGTNAVKCSLYSSMVEMAGFKHNLFFIELWKSALFTAFVAKDVGERLKYENVDLCFTAGLLCDVGQLMMNEFSTEVYASLVMEVKRSKFDIVHAENQVFGFTHVQVGYKLADLWKLPNLYKNVIRYHHDPMAAFGKILPDEFKLVVAIHVANNLSPLFSDQSGHEINMTAVQRAGLNLDKAVLIKSLAKKFDSHYREITRIQEAMFGKL